MLVAESEALVSELDPIVEDMADVSLQSIVDSAWYRLGSVNSLVRDEVGGPLAATLARGLIEQAAYWDWALATGVGVDHLAQWAALELHSLRRLADETEDWTWLGWLMPPGAVLEAQPGAAIPADAYDAVRRIGNGLEPVVLEPLRFRGLFAAYGILGVLTHSNLAGAMMLAGSPQQQLPTRLAAITVHLAAAGATAVALALAGDDARMPTVTSRFEQVAARAATIHVLPRQPLEAAQPPRKPARPAVTEELSAVASAQRMPEAPSGLAGFGLNFAIAAEHLAEVVASQANREVVTGSLLPEQSFWLAMSHVMVIRGTSENTLGKALLPMAARALFEDGARWTWMFHNSQRSTTGESFKALVNEAASLRDKVAQRLVSDGIPAQLVEELLGMAQAIAHSDAAEETVPELREMLGLAYPNPSCVNSARAMYSVLSQFVHATPISNWHICRDTFPSLTAPTYAISLECATQGFERIASITPLLAGVAPKALAEPLDELRARSREVMLAASTYHLLG